MFMVHSAPYQKMQVRQEHRDTANLYGLGLPHHHLMITEATEAPLGAIQIITDPSGMLASNLALILSSDPLQLRHNGGLKRLKGLSIITKKAGRAHQYHGQERQ
mmetsp:Transcript_42280/g.89923  ORF Transcript_42280/g.89923 Transcript_42280/m.89923 type:complete len:104 (-) Transcript_42280:432-743(-)